MHESERNRLINEAGRLRLADADMEQAEAAADALRRGGLNVHLERALETALAVCYARPYGNGNEVGILSEEWKPEPSLRVLHDALLTLRDELYAHAERTDGPNHPNARPRLGFATSYAEDWVPLNRDALPKILDLAARQRARFQKRLQELENQVRP